MATEHEAAVALLYESIHALPHPEYGVINFLPFAHDSEQTRTIKRHLCEAIVALLDGSGFIARDVAPVEPLATHDVLVSCRVCGNELVQLNTNAEGVAGVHAQRFIQAVGRLNATCPHGVITADDMRRHMEREYAQAQEDET